MCFLPTAQNIYNLHHRNILCLSWRLISHYNPIRCSVWRCEKRDRWFMGVWICVCVERFFCVYILCVELVPSLLYPKQMLPLPADTRSRLCDVTVLLANQSELRSLHLPDSYAAVRGEGKSSLQAKLCCCWTFYVGSSECFFYKWRMNSVHWSLLEEHQIIANVMGFFCFCFLRRRWFVFSRSC